MKRKLQIDLPPIRSTTTKKLRFPHPGDIAALYARAAAGELGYSSRAVVLLCLTAQRRETIVTARPEDVGNGLWHVPPAHRKTAAKRQDNRLHVLPWPADVAIGNGEFVFTADRPRRKGDPIPHMASSTLTHALRDAKVGFSPHDVRRSFASTMRMHGHSEAEIALVLDHNEGPSTVMSRHYDAYADLPRKNAMLDVWWGYVRGERKVSSDAWAEATGRRRSVRDAD